MDIYFKREDLDEALTELLKSQYATDATNFNYGVNDALKLVRDMVNGNVPEGLKIPAADVRKNVKARWIDDRTEYVCSACGQRVSDEIFYMLIPNRMLPGFCPNPNCGADMRGGKTNA